MIANHQICVLLASVICVEKKQGEIASHLMMLRIRESKNKIDHKHNDQNRKDADELKLKI